MATGNRLKIRHGTGEPTTSNLLSYELGWNGAALYINNAGTLKKLFGDIMSFTSLTVGDLLVNGNTSFINDVSINGNTSFTNIPTAPTATSGTSNTQLATTAFVTNAISNINLDYLPLTGGNLTGPVITSSTFNMGGGAFKIKYGSTAPDSALLDNSDIYFYIGDPSGGGGGGGGSVVTVTPVLTEGTQSAVITINGVDFNIYSETNTDTKLTQTYASASSYTSWRPLIIGYSSNSTEGFTPSTTTNTSYVFSTITAQPSSGTIRVGSLALYNGSYTSKFTDTTLTANRTITVPDKTGTLALTNDIPTNISSFTNDSGYTTNTGTVTSVRVQATSPITSSTSTAQSSSLNTTIALANNYGDTKNPYASKTANYVLAAPNGSNGTPSFRALVAADIPNLSTDKLTSGTLPIERGGTNATSVSAARANFELGNCKIFYGTCTTSAATTTKEVTCADFTADDLVTGAIIFVKNSYTNSGDRASLQLKVGSTTAKPIKYMYNAGVSDIPSAGYFLGGQTYIFHYDGNNWVIDNMHYNTNTTYTFNGTYNSSTNPAATVATVTNAIGAAIGGSY